MFNVVRLPLALESCNAEASILTAWLGSGTELHVLGESPWKSWVRSVS